MRTEAQNRASRKYVERLKSEGSFKRLTIEFYPSDMALYDHMEKQGAKATYIKRLIREDMERRNG